MCCLEFDSGGSGFHHWFQLAAAVSEKSTLWCPFMDQYRITLSLLALESEGVDIVIVEYSIWWVHFGRNLSYFISIFMKCSAISFNLLFIWLNGKFVNEWNHDCIVVKSVLNMRNVNLQSLILSNLSVLRIHSKQIEYFIRMQLDLVFMSFREISLLFHLFFLFSCYLFKTIYGNEINFV